MINNITLLRSAAMQIDDLDSQARCLSDQKKDIFDNIKSTIAPTEFKAWKEAVKLRQKRRVNRDEIEAHEGLVFEMLNMLEAQTYQPKQNPSVTPLKTPAIDGLDEPVPTRAGESEEINPETGEITETLSRLPSLGVTGGNAMGQPARVAMAVGESSTHPGAMPGLMTLTADIMPDIPDFLRRVS